MRLTRIEHFAADALQVPVHIAACGSDRGAETLTPAERAQLDGFATPARRRDFRRGRLALKSVLQRMGRADDTTAVRFPNPQLSLTHGDGRAFAVGTPASVSGTGVDFEALRPVNPRTARWFLNESELEWLAACNGPDGRDTLIRLWTVKEAVFKCHPQNRALVMTDFTIADPSSCRDVRSADGRRFRTVSFREHAGIITIAITGRGP